MKKIVLLVFSIVMLVSLVACSAPQIPVLIPTAAPVATTAPEVTADPNATTDPNATNEPIATDDGSGNGSSDVKTVAYTWGQGAAFVASNGIPAPAFLNNNVTYYLTTGTSHWITIKTVSVADLDTYANTLVGLGFEKSEMSSPDGKIITLTNAAKKISMLLSATTNEDTQGTITITIDN